MYQIMRITDRSGAAKNLDASRDFTGCIREAKMEEGCVLFHCRYDRKGEPADRFLRTSRVQDWKKDPETGRITMETMNSVYILDQVRME